MKTKLLSIMSLIVVAMCAVFISCSEDMGYGEKTNENVKAVVKMAKQMYESNGSVVSLPNPSANKHAVSRSAMTHLADLNPMWDEAFTYEQGNETVVIVPLECEDEIRSNLSIIEGDETTYQFAKVFSRMIVKPSEGENGIYVLSYMPESNYAATYANLESEMGYNPTDVDFTGLIVSSRLDGETLRSFLYNEGVLSHTFAPFSENHDTKSASTEHATHDIMLKQELQLASASRSNVHGIGSESENICNNCLQWNWYCTCDNEKEKKEICSLCGAVYELAGEHNCGTTQCPVCKQSNCICNNPATEPCKTCKQDPCVCGEPKPQACEECNRLQCICGRICEDCGYFKENCICKPTDYDPHDNDVVVGMVECVEPNISCAMAVLEMAYMAYGGEYMNQQSFAQYYTQINYMSPEENTVLNYNDNFMTHFFETSSFTSMSDAINNNNVVVVRKDGHYMLVFGLQYDGGIIYADPHDGEVKVVSVNYFNGCEAFEINGISENQRRMRL